MPDIFIFGGGFAFYTFFVTPLKFEDLVSVFVFTTGSAFYIYSKKSLTLSLLAFFYQAGVMASILTSAYPATALFNSSFST
jgi:hypothetical protein